VDFVRFLWKCADRNWAELFVQGMHSQTSESSFSPSWDSFGLLEIVAQAMSKLSLIQKNVNIIIKISSMSFTRTEWMQMEFSNKYLFTIFDLTESSCKKCKFRPSPGWILCTKVRRYPAWVWQITILSIVNIGISSRWVYIGMHPGALKNWTLYIAHCGQIQSVHRQIGFVMLLITVFVPLRGGGGGGGGVVVSAVKITFPWWKLALNFCVEILCLYKLAKIDQFLSYPVNIMFYFIL
jgi:hypothetical protein